MSIERINEMASKMVIFGWLAGLAFYNWFSSSPISVPVWAHFLLVIVGIFASSILIGGGMAVLAGMLTKIITGNSEGSPHAFSWAAFISPILAFFAAKYSLMLFQL